MKIKKWEVSVLESKRINQVHDADFFTSDTDVNIQIELKDNHIQPETATVLAYNESDDSVVEEEVSVVDNLIDFPFYTEDRDLVEHKGTWLIKVIFHYDGKRYTSREIVIFVNGNITDGLPQRLEIIDNWNSIQTEIDDMRLLYNEIQEKLSTGEFKGEQGPEGPEGPIGPAGKDGDPFKYQDFTTEQLEGLRGPAGRNGTDGRRGPEGPIGPAPNWQVITGPDYEAITPDPNTVYLVIDANKSELDMYKLAVDTIVGVER